MKKGIILLFLLIALNAAAQRHPYVTVAGGVSLPVFDYAAKNLLEGSFATPGFTTGLTADYPFGNHWGLEAEAAFHIHAVDVSVLGYEKVQSDPFLLDVTIRSEPYRILSFLTGPTWTANFTNKIQFQAVLLAGYFASRSPYQLYKPTYFMTGPAYFEITTSLDRSFAWGGSALISYAITPCYSIGISAQFKQTEAAFQFRTTDGSIRTDKRTIGFLNFNIAILFKLPAIQAKTRQ